MGKHPGADTKMGKATYPSIAGGKTAEQRVQELHQEAILRSRPSGERAKSLQALATYIATRDS